MSDTNLKIIPIGGVEEIGTNCTVYEYKDQIMVVDMGAGFPDADMYGVDLMIPNIDYLEKRKSQIDGIFITHGHLDHIGALKYLLPKLDFPPVYGTSFTIALIKTDLEEEGLLEKARLHVINEDSVLSSGDFTVSFFRVNHSIPQCVGLLIETPTAKAVHTGDFKFDNSPINEPVADYAKIAKIGEKGVDILLSDSTNSLRKGHPISESEVAKSLEDTIERAKGRVVIATFSGLVGRLYQIMQIAHKQGRKVAIAGYSMNKTLRLAQEIDYIKPAPGLIVPIQKINRYNDEKVIILTTGAQGESNAALFRMASGEYKGVELKKGDTVIISAGTIPGNNLAVQNLIEAISARGAIVHQSESMDFFTSGHGYQEDQKIMINLVKPKYFMPVHGYLYFMREHGRTAVQVGIKEQNVIIAKRGQIIEGRSTVGFSHNGNVKANPILVSGTGVGDVGESVLAERHRLGNHGVIVIDMIINREKRTLLGDPFVVTRGFVFARSKLDLLAEIRAKANTFVSAKLKHTLDVAELRAELEDKLGKFVRDEIGRDPVILSLITFSPGANKDLAATGKGGAKHPRKGLYKQKKQDSKPTPEQVAAKWQIPKESLELLKPKA